MVHNIVFIRNLYVVCWMRYTTLLFVCYVLIYVAYYRQGDDESICRDLAELLDKESQSPVFMEGISCSLFKVAELGLVSAAEVLLRHGADLNFEGTRMTLYMITKNCL